MTRRLVRLFAPRAQGSLAALAAAGLWLAGCSGGGGADDTLTVDGDVAIAYAKRANSVQINPTNGAPFAPGGDLIVREKSSPSAPEHNVTRSITQGNGDVSDPEVSYDGKKIAFALRCPASNTSTIEGAAACTGRWNLWEYDMSAGGLAGGTLRRITSSTEFDDVDPAYLPAGRGFVFSSNRQDKSSRNQALGVAYHALDEYERERVFNLHTVDAQGQALAQITFNQSHDRNPVVRQNGDIMFSRWEHVADNNRFTIFRAKPDGTDLFVLYGKFSPGNSFLHPREMDPAGAYAGHVASSLMSLSGTQEGGTLVFIDVANYSEQDTPVSNAVPPQGGQREVTEQVLNKDRGFSFYGRITAPYPLWDGTNRVLLAYRPCQVTKRGNVVPCATLTDEEIARISDEDRMEADVEADEIQDNVPASYAIYMFDSVKRTWLIVAAPPEGFMYTDPVAIQARTEPSVAQPTTVDPALAAQDLALIEVRSLFDTDGLGRMGDPVIVDADLPAGCTTGIAKTAPTDPADTRTEVADLVRLKNPADAAYHCSPVRFVRALRAIAPPSSMMGLRSAIGETNFEQQQILGYAPVEPDGSFKLQVPADIPLALQIVDAEGRAFQTHTNWIQVRPGERRTCDGCHSPRRGAALNSGTTVNTMPAALSPALAGAQLPGETMASIRTRLNAQILSVKPDPEFTDVWADTAQNGVVARTPITLRYTGNANPADDLATPAPTSGVINYPEHIAPLWTRARGANTCTNCHADPARLDLRSTIGGTGRMTSYDELLLGDPLIDATTGQPVIVIEDGVPMVERGIPLVDTGSGSMGNAGQARKSRLTEILWGQTLLAGDGARTAHPNPPGTAPNHATLLNRAEKRLLAEWMDLGGQYYNNPFTPGNGVRTVTGLSEENFTAQVMPILGARCAGCHAPVGTNDGSPTLGRANRFVLTGSTEGDFGVTLSMVNDTCNAAANPLLARPSTVPHPSGGSAAVLPTGSADYNTIAAWIAQGCSNP